VRRQQAARRRLLRPRLLRALLLRHGGRSAARGRPRAQRAAAGASSAWRQLLQAASHAGRRGHHAWRPLELLLRLLLRGRLHAHHAGRRPAHHACMLCGTQRRGSVRTGLATA
jgi:hypothetical protein